MVRGIRLNRGAGQPGTIIGAEYVQTGRKWRRPRHDFYVRHRPFAIQPFCLAPVLPGETLKQGLLQARVVTHPIANPLIGWNIEHYLFYVKHRDMTGREILTDWTLNPATDISTLQASGTTNVYYARSGQMKWVEMCLQRVVEEFFRDEGEAWNNATIDGLPLAKFNKNGWTDSVKLKSALESLGDDLPDDADNASMDDLDRLQQQYMFLKEMKLTEMTYEDFLRSYGIRGPMAEDPHKPELLRYVREWSYPTNTIDPTDGSPTSAVSWSVADRVDKDRFFTEPGFIFGVTCARPKVYFKNQNGAAAGWFINPFHWMPAVMQDHPWASLISHAGASGASTVISTDYVWDARDVYVYGDQFLSQDVGTPVEAQNFFGNPTATAGARFPSPTDIRALFVDTTDASTAANFVRQDGSLLLNILGRQQDMT